MFLKDEKKALTRLALLSVGWGIGLDRFYEGKTRDGFLALLGWAIIFGSLIFFMPCHGYEYAENGKSLASESISPLIILPLSFGIYGIVLVLRKVFRLLRQFELVEEG
ncbi:hypothetical protein [Prochlorococcus marinus]|uniref:TM2 domain-containing protein n=1 Tax=Prochlorococcus marinus (strain MIT 9211) TaxID=93059 RepID=A9BBZ8_PROM4|nr:hypothetical protein [Prochlorococcus marinus]ABX09360.1 Hypothetical protein P9211_14291 [Prochlorococcus marinus str. MIT 9211]